MEFIFSFEIEKKVCNLYVKDIDTERKARDKNVPSNRADFYSPIYYISKH